MVRSRSGWRPCAGRSGPTWRCGSTSTAASALRRPRTCSATWPTSTSSTPSSPSRRPPGPRPWRACAGSAPCPSRPTSRCATWVRLVCCSMPAPSTRWWSSRRAWAACARPAAIVELATAAAVPVTVSTLFETGVGLAGALHLAATAPGPQAHGLATAELLESDLLLAPLADRARVAWRCPTGPGLGIELDAAAVERYPRRMSRLAPDPLVMRAARRPHEPALRASRRRPGRAAQLLDAADGLAPALVGEGVGAGRPGRLPARPTMRRRSRSSQAARRLGIVLVPLNRRAAAAELHAAARDGRRRGAHPRRGTCRPGPRARASGRLDGASHRGAAGRGAPAGPAARRLRDEVDLDAPAIIVFTSGTTGRPKGAMLTHGNLAASAHAWAGVLRPRASDRWLACLPLYHVAGLAIVTRADALGRGARGLGRLRRGRGRGAIDDGVSHLSLVPAQLADAARGRASRPRGCRPRCAPCCSVADPSRPTCCTAPVQPATRCSRPTA